MDRLEKLFRAFNNLPTAAGEIIYATHFVRLMETILYMIQEALVDATHTRSDNDFYMAIFNDIEELQRHLTEYLEAVERDLE